MQTNREFFCDAIRMYEKDLYAVAFSIVKNEQDAADVIQESVLKAYSKLDTLRDREQVKPWILKIVHHTAISYLRSRAREQSFGEREETPCSDFSPDTDTKLTVWAYVQQLKLPYRLVMILFYYQNYSVQEIARITGTPAPTVRQQLTRGRKMLANRMKKEDFYDGSV